MRPSPLIFYLGIMALLFKQCYSTCYSYEDGDTFPTDNTSYCLNILQWDVSASTFTTSAARDASALNNYTILYNNYYLLGKVNIDCLGMANYFFCAKAYPTCDSYHPQIESMCSWMCELFSVRCGTENQFYHAICQNGAQSQQACSFQDNLMRLAIALLGVILTILLL